MKFIENKISKKQGGRVIVEIRLNFNFKIDGLTNVLTLI